MYGNLPPLQIVWEFLCGREEYERAVMFNGAARDAITGELQRQYDDSATLPRRLRIVELFYQLTESWR